MRYENLIKQAEQKEARAHKLELQAQENKMNLAAYARSLFRMDVRSEAEKIARSDQNKLDQALELQRKNERENAQIRNERQALADEKKQYRERLEAEVWSNYQVDMCSKLKRYGIFFTAIALIICIALCIKVHSSTKKNDEKTAAALNKNYVTTISKQKKQIKKLQKKASVADSRFYLCERSVTGKVLKDGYFDEIKIQKGELVRLKDIFNSKVTVLYHVATYGTITVELTNRQFIGFSEVSLPD